MNNAKEFPVRAPTRFSTGWCIIAALLHLAATFAIVGLHFLAGMGSFTRDMSSEIAFWKAAQWIWTPLAMAAWNPQNMHNNGSLIALALLWSCCVGILVSFAVPSFRRWLHKPLYPPATHHDNTRNA